MESIIDGGVITYWLVDHPAISNFEWKRGTTLGSTLQFLALTVLSYLSLTFLLLRSSSSLIPSPPPRLLRFFTVAYNLFILLLSAAMAAGCSLSALSRLPSPKWLFCFPPSAAHNNAHPRRQLGPVFFWAYVFYLSKILEFVDTALIILSAKAKEETHRRSSSNRRLSFLHVYHHAVVVVMCYLWLDTSQSLFPIALVTNAAVHTVMYGYYLMCAVGIRPSWKRAVTDCQIAQFVFGFLASVVMLYYHFAADDEDNSACSGIGGWCFNAIFNSSLLYLFVDFHSKNYNRRNKRAGQEQGFEEGGNKDN